MKKNNLLPLILMFSTSLILLGACSLLSSSSETDATGTEELPTPVTIPTQLRSQAQVESQTCLVAEKVAIQTDEVQGDLMAWSPNKDELAFVQPVNQYNGWYIGNILVYDAEDAEESFTSENETVSGDLTWSPDGDALAYVSLDQEEGIYTIKMLTLLDGVEVDLFGEIENARTDDFASLKAIREWPTASSLIVTSYCGTDCVRVYEFNPVSLVLNQQEEIRQNEDTSLVIANETSSPDGNWQLSVDENNNIWLTSTPTNQVSILLLAAEVSEYKWSKDSDYLALRTADMVRIYKLGCTPK